jgi:hypothetical protein
MGNARIYHLQHLVLGLLHIVKDTLRDVHKLDHTFHLVVPSELRKFDLKVDFFLA